MDDLNSTEMYDNTPQREELSHTDKISGLISSPVQTFEEMSYFKPKVIDWFLPIVVLILVTVLSNLVIMSSPEVKSQIQGKQIEMMKENFDKQVDAGNMTADEAEKQFNSIVDRMQDKESGMNIFANVNIIVGVFIFFFIIATFFFIVARFILKDQGSYSHALVAYGFPSYITAIQVIVTTLITVLTGQWVTGTSLNTIVGADSLSINGFLMSKLDPFRIWYYILISIGFAKMFKSPNITKYYIVIFSIWIGFGLILLLLAQNFPWLRFAVM
jgi:hypothetical protein